MIFQIDDVVRITSGHKACGNIFTVTNVIDDWCALIDKSAWGGGATFKDLTLLFRPDDGTLGDLVAALTRPYDDAAEWKDAKPGIVAQANELAALYFPEFIAGECVECGQPTSHRSVKLCDTHQAIMLGSADGDLDHHTMARSDYGKE
jgi:hypothetical protein